MVGERGKWSGRWNGAHSGMKLERNVPPQSRRRKPAAFAGGEIPLVTSARFAKWNGLGRAGHGADRRPVERSKRTLVTAKLT